MSIGDKFVHVQVEDSGVDVHVTADISSTTTYRYSNRTSIDKDGAQLGKSSGSGSSSF